MQGPKRNDKAEFLPGERVNVLLPRPFDQAFTYRVAEDMCVMSGSYVTVPFGRQELQGIIWGDGETQLSEAQCKTLLQHYDFIPAMSASMRQFVDFVADYTVSQRGLVLKMVLSAPDALRKPERETVYRLAQTAASARSQSQRSVVAYLRQANTWTTKATLMAETGCSASLLRQMVNSGQLAQDHHIVQQQRPVVAPLSAPLLREEQQHAADQLTVALNRGFHCFALEGVTGSGKTEVYFDLIASLLQDAEAQILVLLPEIALTTQWIQRFEARFAGQAVLWHSTLSPAKRRRSWQAIASGAAPLVVGARSALFLPFRHLRLIIVDEEHEASYKQEEQVIYQARDMAVARAKMEHIPVLLCSASLSMETKFNIDQNRYTPLYLHQRHGSYQEPLPELIDLRQDKPERDAWLSPPLRRALIDNLAAGQQSMLYLNRRGYAPLLLCRGCGYRFQCTHCSAWMVAHHHPPRLICHHCEQRLPYPEVCPECSSEKLAPCGPGVERVAEELADLLPQARYAVLTSESPDMPAVISAMLEDEIDILIGTQLLAKGHHFPNLTLVGVVDGDIGLGGGDLRAGERTYQLLHQLAGRAGRERDQARVMIQTTQPEHPLMQALSRGDRAGYYEQESAWREAGNWPPYGRLAAIRLEGSPEKAVKQAAQRMMQAAPAYRDIAYLGPAPAPIAKRRGRYRYHILIKSPKNKALQPIIREWLAGATLPRNVLVRVDIDPYHFM